MCLPFPHNACRGGRGLSSAFPVYEICRVMSDTETEAVSVETCSAPQVRALLVPCWCPACREGGGALWRLLAAVLDVLHSVYVSGSSKYGSSPGTTSAPSASKASRMTRKASPGGYPLRASIPASLRVLSCAGWPRVPASFSPTPFPPLPPPPSRPPSSLPSRISP